MAQVQLQRPLRGSRISTFYPVKNLPSLSSLDSAFQLQEYISLLIRLDVHDVDAIVSVPGRGKQKDKGKETETDDAKEDAKEKEKERKVEVDEACWKYEQLRRLAQDLSHPLITMLQQVCTRTTCPEMKAGEWLYLCVAHGNDGAMEQCCAIDYILHTLDSATALLNSPRAFPSRLQIPATSHRHFTSLARRLGRIFAHAYFHHREEFEQAEAESSLYARFLALTEKFDLVPADFLVIPRALAAPASAPGDRRGSMVPLADVPPPTLLGAALHVDTNTASPESDAGAGREKSASPPGLDDALSPRRYGRSRTDTMMLEGDKDRDGRFPASPASAVEEGGGLDAAFAAAGKQMLSDLPSVSASPVVEPGLASASAAETAAAPLVEEPESQSEAERERDIQQRERELQEREREEPPSPTSDEEAGLAPLAGAMSMISPSSSTAPQSETPILLEVEQGLQSPNKPDGASPTTTTPATATPAPEKAEEGPVPMISVEPATPPAFDEAEEDKGMERESVVAAVDAIEEAAVAKEAEAAAATSGPVAETAAPKTDAAVMQEELKTAEAPAPAVDTAVPAADEEVDVTDGRKDTEVAVGDAVVTEQAVGEKTEPTSKPETTTEPASAP
ncbi:Mob1/phocein [Mycena crocata]|nr:Mob1/phocein [Mycena crocata]